MILPMYQKVSIISYNIIIGIGYIKKDSKNQIKIEPNFYDLFPESQKNPLQLDEDNNKKKKNNIEKDKNKIIKLNNIKNEINFIKYLIDGENKELLLYKNNNNKNNLNKINNEKYKFTINLSINNNEQKVTEPNILEILNIVTENKSSVEDFKELQKIFKIELKKTDEKKEKKFLQIKKERDANELFNDEYIDIINNQKTINEIKFEPIQNNNNFNFNFRKDSMSNFSSIGDLYNFNSDKENLFE